MNYMTNPLFSVIVPVYNIRSYIGITLQSILDQTFNNFEIVVIDDGSTDGSRQIVEALAEKDRRIKLLCQENSGVSAARNLGLENATGDWIIFVDGDDALRRDALEILSNCIANTPKADLIGYGFKKVNTISQESLYSHDDIFSIKDIAIDCKTKSCFKALNHYTVWSETYRRKKHNVRFEPLRNGEDVLYCNRLGLRSDYYVEIQAELYLYLQRGVSAKNNNWSEERLNDYIAMHEGIYHNIKSCQKDINMTWLKRWVGNLLNYVSDAWHLEYSIQKEYYNRYHKLLLSISKLKILPLYLKLWLKFVTLFDSKEYFRLTAMFPMIIYSRILK